MKKNLSFTLILVCSFLAVKSQNYPYPTLENGETTAPLHGIKSDLMYQTLIKSKATQTELLKKITGFLVQSRLLDTTKNKIAKVTDKVTEFTIPLQFRSGFVAGKGKTALAKRLRHPLVLTFDAQFKFAESGITVTFTNFKEQVFYEIRHYTEGNYPPELGFNFPVGDPKAADLEKLKDDVMQGATVFGKIMTIYEAGGTSGQIRISGKGVSVETDKAIQNKFAELNNSLDDQFKVIQEAVKNNAGQWLYTPAEALTYFNKLQPKYKKLTELAQGRVAQGYLLVTDNDRWDNYFEKIFNDALLNITNLIDGTITNIQKGNVVRYTMVDGSLQLQKVTN